VDKLHNEELNELYCSPNIVRVIKLRRMRWRNVLPMREEKVYRALVGKLREWDRLKNRHRWEDNIMMEFQEVACRGMDWTELAQGRDKRRKLMNAVINDRVP
jgi:hypothetical protein